MTTIDRNQIARQFLQRVLGPIPQDSCIELRVKRNEKDARPYHIFMASVTELDVTKFAVNEHVWFGVALRKLGAKHGRENDLTWAMCVWADFDKVEEKTALLLKLQQFMVPPTLVVDSGGGLHAYWRLNKPLNMQDETQKKYLREVVYGLAVALGADPTVHDPTRVLRMPATFNAGNMKSKVYNPPRETAVVHDSSAVYGVEDLSRFRREVPQASTSTPTPPTRVDVAESVLPAEQLHIPERFRKLVVEGWGEGCGFPSRSELDMAVIIAMLRGGHTDDDVIATFTNPAYKIREKALEKGSDGARYLAVTIQSAKEWIAKSREPTTLRENAGVMESLRSGRWVPVFNRPMRALAKLTGAEQGFHIEIPTEDGPQRRTLNYSDFVTTVAFKRALKMAGAWTGTDQDVQLLIPYFEAQRPPLRRAVRIIGWEDGSLIFPDAHMRPDGTIVHDTDYLYLGKMGAHLKESDDWGALVRQVLPHLSVLHTREGIIPIIGWFMATFVAPQVRAISGGAFPILMVFGTPEAGKTTILETMRALTGTTSALESAPANTRFANIDLLSGTNTVPVVYDEHRLNEVRHHKHNLYPLLRHAYDASITTRGRPDLTVVRYRIIAPVALGGETPFRDTALVDRTLHVRLERAGKNEAALASLQLLPLDEFNAGFYQHVRTKDLRALWEEAGKRLPESLRSNKLQVRQRHAWTVAALGLLLLQPFWSHDLAVEVIGSMGAMRDTSSDDITVSTKAVVFEAVRILVELIRSGRLRDGTDYLIRLHDNEHWLWFVPAIVLPAIEEYVQRYPTDLPMSRETMLGRMREDAVAPNPVIIQYQQSFKAGTHTHRGIALSLEQVEESMGIPVDHWLKNSIAHAEEAPR